MTIVQKLLTLAGVAAASLLLVGGVGVQGLSRSSAAMQQVKLQSIPGLHLLHEIKSDQQQIAITLFRDSIATDEQTRSGLAQQLRQLSSDISGRLERYAGFVRTDKGRELYTAEKKLLDEYQVLLKSYLDAHKDGATQSLAGPMGAKRAELAKVLDEHIDLGIRAAGDESMQAMTMASNSMYTTIGAIIVAMLGVGWLSLSTTRSIKKSLLEIQRTMAQVEERLDFTVRARVYGNDEISSVSRNLNRLVEKMAASLSEISRHVSTVESAASEMNASAASASQAAVAQSDAAADMAAGVEEMTVSITHVSDRAMEARDTSHKAGDLASEGARIIGHTAENIRSLADAINAVAHHINDLEDQGNRISSIVSVIREVAEQTNLLALNAAIEAARAGEQGRGFAVVADEVRKLAERTSGSTEEITRMVQTIRAISQEAATGMSHAVQTVTSSVDQANAASEAISGIGSESLRALGMAEEISSSIREQSATSTSIAGHVERMARIAEENSATARGNANFAHELESRAHEMQRAISAYRL